jgi:hypothetical protein
VTTPPPGDPTPEPAPVPERPPDEVPAADSQRIPIVVIERGTPPLRLPSLLPSPVGELAATTGGGDRLGTEGGSRSQSGSESGTRRVESARDIPPLPGLPFSGGAPSDLYVSAGGSSGSSGGFFPLVLAGLVAFLAAAAQRRSGLLSLALAPPRCAAFVRCLERPD